MFGCIIIFSAIILVEDESLILQESFNPIFRLQADGCLESKLVPRAPIVRIDMALSYNRSIFQWVYFFPMETDILAW